MRVQYWMEQNKMKERCKMEKEKLELCKRCGGTFYPVWFTEEERIRNIPTGRYRRACSHLECCGCGKSVCVDSSMDGSWRTYK